MGGHAFSSQPGPNGEPILPCPRLPPETYNAVRDALISRMEHFFYLVIVPAQAPAKHDHGDVDMLVSSPKPALNHASSLREMIPHLAKAVGARRSYCNQYNVGFFAIMLPAGILSSANPAAMIAEYGVGNDTHDEIPGENTYVQLDVQFCNAPSKLGWQALQIAYGELSDILRVGLRPAGFVIKPSGFFMHNREMQQGHTAHKLTFLSNDVREVFAFLGLCYETYAVGFATKADLFHYATSARYFSRDAFNSTGKVCKEYGKDHKGYVAYKSARRNDWNLFTNSWLPAHPDVGALPINQQEVFTVAMAHFNAWPSYYAKTSAWVATKREDAFWLTIQPLLQKHLGPSFGAGRIHNIIVALKRYTVFTETQGTGKAPTLGSAAETEPRLWPSWTAESAEGGHTDDELRAWLLQNWERAYEMDRARTRGERQAARERAQKRKKNRRFGAAGLEVLSTARSITGFVVVVTLPAVVAMVLWKMRA